MTAWLTVVGLGEDGLDGLTETARQALAQASVLFGGQRHLDMVPAQDGQDRIAWPSPFAAAFDMVLARRGQSVCILASGDPMFYGMGASLSKRLEVGEMRVIPAPSSFSLAAVRLGWALQDCVLLTVHGRPLEIVHPHLHPGNRLLILSEDGQTPARLAELLRQRGFGPSTLSVLEHMGGPLENRHDGQASDWSLDRTADLNVVAVDCWAEDGAALRSCLCGLPDDAFITDGQLTKRDVRAVTLARLAPRPRELLWDVGGGSGSIGIEWMLSHPTCRTISIEANPSRQDMIAANALALGVPGLHLVRGPAPEALIGLESPDVIFIGGGLTVDGVPEFCWNALKPGGRMVANAVTIQSEALLVALRDRWGGELVRISVAQASPVGRFDCWRTAMPVTIWSAEKPRS